MEINIFFNILLLIILFFVLNWSADFTVKNIKYLGLILKIRLFAFGILLGLITSLPEFFLGISATIDRAAALSVGNLLGGVIVILGFILGSILFLNKKIITDGKFSSLIPIALVIFSPILLGVDGVYNFFDGLIMILLYVGLVFYLYYQNRFDHYPDSNKVKIINRSMTSKAIFFAILGMIGILISSNWIVEITLGLLNHVQVSKLVIGLVVFSIGTNLPEISIAVTSWRKNTAELSLSHLLSTSFTNTLILGILSILNPIVFKAGLPFWTTALFLGMTLIFLVVFYRSKKKLDSREGVILLTMYFLFTIINIYLGFL